ncbi:hypothetical protein RHMOL_Rhmol07G0007400 [Rhododendron molle]|uniref:Uncharacterized protein n=1 Tax=Rhododendron molle TaxID=49168 RepID=A0ACC0MVQ6_RHOML|nr:hypothetical protein RHMOL_Rhmol07G0007400 [Rhododendron molle]
MECTSFSITSSPLPTVAKDTLQEHHGLRRTFSGMDLCARARMKRSYSDNHIVHSINRSRASTTEPQMKNSRSMGFFNFKLAGPIFPNSLRSFLFDEDTNKDMDMAETTTKKTDMPEENSFESDDEDEAEMKKRVNWIERIVEIRSHWRERQQKANFHSDGVIDQDWDEDHEGGCEADYSDEEEEGNTKIDSESFSRLLVQVPWSDAKRFSQLAFLCNMAYAIPDIEAKDLRRQYGLYFVTSSLEKKSKAAALKAKLDQDLTREPVASSATIVSNGGKAVKSPEKCPNCPAIAYEIAASAASYVQSCSDDLLPLGYENKQGGDDRDLYGNEAYRKEEGGSCSPRVYKSEVAAYVTAASTMTAVVAAGEKDKQEAAKDLQSLHSSPCEWFICDDPSTYTRQFIIQGSDSVASWHANLFFEPTKFEKLLYSPMGKIFILQPDEKSSPPHPLLPSGSAFYAVENTRCSFTQNALKAFLNSPHPLETLSNPTAYGSEGTILRDHDSSNYLKAVNGVIRQHTKTVVRKQGSLLWPLLTTESPRAWSHEHNLEENRVVKQEVMTSV